MNYKNVAISRVSDKFFKVGEVIPIISKTELGVTIRSNIAVSFNDPDFIFMFNTTNEEINKVVETIINKE
jgi:hypothetical protein